MAGSWRHMTTDKGRLRNVSSFHSMLDTGGDVYEAAEECFGMVWWLAERWAETVGSTDRARLLEIIAQAEEHYQDGVRLGGRQRDR